MARSCLCFSDVSAMASLSHPKNLLSLMTEQSEQETRGVDHPEELLRDFRCHVAIATLLQCSCCQSHCLGTGPNNEGMLLSTASVKMRPETYRSISPR